MKTTGTFHSTMTTPDVWRCRIVSPPGVPSCGPPGCGHAVGRWICSVLIAFFLFGSSLPVEAESAPGPQREPYRDPAVTAVRSLVLPGWGQHSNGESGKGWLFTSMAIFGVLLGTEVISPGLLKGNHEEHNLEKSLGWFLYGGTVVWATADAYTRAAALNRENGYQVASLATTGGNTSGSSTVFVSLFRWRF